MNNHTRRSFLRTAATTAVTGILGSSLLPDSLRSQLPPDDNTPNADTSAPRRPSRRRKKEDPRPLLKPPKLSTGDTIALVAPASGISRGEILEATETLKRLGFAVKAGGHLTKEFGYLAGPR